MCQREIYRYNKNYSEADAIRSSLKAIGVEIYDKESRWTANDGRSGTVPKYAEAEAMMASSGAAAAPQAYGSAYSYQ